MNSDVKEIEEKTWDWVERIVVGWNLCPFAAKPWRRGRIRLVVIQGSDEEKVLDMTQRECLHRSEMPGTTLVVMPDFYPDDFMGYLDCANWLSEERLPELELDGIIQIATLHPRFQFGDSENALDDYTNRSPYPIFHILREDEVTQATKKLGGDASKVWKRNVNLMRTLGEQLGSEAALETAIRNKQQHNSQETKATIQQTLQQLKLDVP